MKLVKIIPLIIALLVLSCGSPSVYKKFYDDFPENRWKKSDVKVFEFTLENDGEYNLLLDFSHVYGFPIANIPLSINITKPDGVTTPLSYPIILADADGNSLSDCSGDYCDWQMPILKNQKMAAGKYKITVANAFDHPYLPNVLGVGIRIVNVNNQ